MRNFLAINSVIQEVWSGTTPALIKDAFIAGIKMDFDSCDTCVVNQSSALLEKSCFTRALIKDTFLAGIKISFEACKRCVLNQSSN